MHGAVFAVAAVLVALAGGLVAVHTADVFPEAIRVAVVVGGVVGGWGMLLSTIGAVIGMVRVEGAVDLLPYAAAAQWVSAIILAAAAVGSHPEWDRTALVLLATLAGVWIAIGAWRSSR